MTPDTDGWIACSDRMPPIGWRVLVSERYDRVVIATYGPPPVGFSYPADHPNIWWAMRQLDWVTHWRELPMPPIPVPPRERALVRMLEECIDSLEYVNQSHPEATGSGVRAERIAKARALLAPAVAADGRRGRAGE